MFLIIEVVGYSGGNQLFPVEEAGAFLMRQAMYCPSLMSLTNTDGGRKVLLDLLVVDG